MWNCNHHLHMPFPPEMRLWGNWRASSITQHGQGVREGTHHYRLWAWKLFPCTNGWHRLCSANDYGDLALEKAEWGQKLLFVTIWIHQKPLGHWSKGAIGWKDCYLKHSNWIIIPTPPYWLMTWQWNNNTKSSLPQSHFIALLIMEHPTTTGGDPYVTAIDRGLLEEMWDGDWQRTAGGDVRRRLTEDCGRI